MQDQRRPAHDAERAPGAATDAGVAARLGAGEPLASSVRGPMERGFREDLGSVRLHRDAQAAQLADQHGAAALTVGQHLVFGANEYAPDTLSGQVLLAHELAHTLQQRGTHAPAREPTPAGVEAEAIHAAIGALVGQPQPLTRQNGLRLQRCSKDEKKSAESKAKEATGQQLLGQFAAKFSDSAARIRGNPASMDLLREAEAAGASFGGYSEDGPQNSAWPYTVGTTVYVPRAFQADAGRAMSSFMFELTNAISRPRHAEVQRKGREGSISAEQFAHDTVAIEIDGKMRMAEIWATQRDAVTDDAERARLDAQNFYQTFLDVKAGRKSREEIIQDVLTRTYPDTGQTVKDYYVEQYNRMRGSGSSP